MGVERLEKLHIYLKGRSSNNSFKWSLYPRQVGKTRFSIIVIYTSRVPKIVKNRDF